MKQTAVDYLLSLAVGENIFDDLEIEKAKEMEKENTCHFGAKCCIMTTQKKSWTIDELYNETFKNK